MKSKCVWCGLKYERKKRWVKEYYSNPLLSPHVKWADIGTTFHGSHCERQDAIEALVFLCPICYFLRLEKIVDMNVMKNPIDYEGFLKAIKKERFGK